MCLKCINVNVFYLFCLFFVLRRKMKQQQRIDVGILCMRNTVCAVIKLRAQKE